ncbi:MAG: CBM96 family carbohydrate-binding protein [Promethearchaeota archaeon]
MRRSIKTTLIFSFIFASILFVANINIKIVAAAQYEYPKLYAIDDAPVYSDQPDANHGSDGEAFVGLNDGWFYIKFNSSEIPNNTSGKLYSKAELRFCRLNNDENYIVDFKVHAVNDNNWDEDTITWNNKPPLGSELYSGTSNPNEGEYVVDVTEQIKNGIVSFAIVSTTSDGNIKIGTKESSENNQSVYLFITYEDTEFISVNVDKNSYESGPIIITYDSKVPLENLVMELVDSSNNVVTQIASNLPASDLSGYSWNPSNLISEYGGKQYRIRVRTSDSMYYGLSDLFTIVEPEPSIPGYPTLILGLAGFVSAILISRKIKK